MHTRWRYPLNRADGSNQNIVRLACLFQITSTFDSHAQKQEITVITGSISFVRKCKKTTPLHYYMYGGSSRRTASTQFLKVLRCEQDASSVSLLTTLNAYSDQSLKHQSSVSDVQSDKPACIIELQVAPCINISALKLYDIQHALLFDSPTHCTEGQQSR